MRKKLPTMLSFLVLGTISLLAGIIISDTSTTCKKEKYATKEPGTCLSPRAYNLLEGLKMVKIDPFDSKVSKKFLDFLEPAVYQVVNALVPAKESSVPIRIYYPNKRCMQTEIVFYIHGGSFAFGSVEEYEMMTKKLARVTQKIIVAIDYRLAPEFPFPAALNDCYAVVQWLSENYELIGGTSGKIAVMGDSAGGNLATVLVLKCRDEGKELISSQVLFYPPTTFSETEYPSRLYFLKDENRTYILSEQLLRQTKTDYLPDSISEQHPYVSPLSADLHGKIPPALIITAQIDPLRDEGRLYAERLMESGQEVVYHEYKGVIHGFATFYMVFPEAKQAMKMAKAFIEEHANE
ncbi:alpha/beta hydrolase [Bacteroidota bacterium]